MNILYLHGLKSKLSTKKRAVLERFGKVHAPNIDYDQGYIRPVGILKEFEDIEFNVVIGSSMGALNAFVISENIGRPALLFNPPLSKYASLTFSARFTKGPDLKQLLLGGSDNVVDASETLKFLSSRIQKEELFVQVDPHLEHRIPLEPFQEQVGSFFAKLCF